MPKQWPGRGKQHDVNLVDQGYAHTSPHKRMQQPSSHNTVMTTASPKYLEDCNSQICAVFGEFVVSHVHNPIAIQIL